MIDATRKIVNDVTGQNPVDVWAVITPRSVDEVMEAVARTEGPLSIGGSCHTTGGQIAATGSVHLDLRGLNQVLLFAPLEGRLRVQAGIRWREVLRFIDPHDMALRIPQTWSNFTVGGSVSVNGLGRTIGTPPLADAIRSLRLVMPDGQSIEVSPTRHPDLFHGAIGGYGALGVIVEVEFDLVPNRALRRHPMSLSLRDYVLWLRARSYQTEGAVLHTAELGGRDLDQIRGQYWTVSDDRITEPGRLQPPDDIYPFRRLLPINGMPGGSSAWWHEQALDKLQLSRPAVHWQNYETSHALGHLEASLNAHGAPVIQEYYIPVERIEEFASRLRDVAARHELAPLQVTLRLAEADPGTLLAWARGQTLAVMIQHRPRHPARALGSRATARTTARANAGTTASRQQQAIWTRELIDAAIACGGCHHLGYRVDASPEQFHAAYPRARELFALKSRLDPRYRLRNRLWDTYYAPTLERYGNPSAPGASVFQPSSGSSAFHAVLHDPVQNDRLYHALLAGPSPLPASRIHARLVELAEQHESAEAIYFNLLRDLPRMDGRHRDFIEALSAPRAQRRALVAQTLRLLGDRREFDGLLELGTGGYYTPALRRALKLRGRRLTTGEDSPRLAPADPLSRWMPWWSAERLQRDSFEPLPPSVAEHSLGLITCYEGLHRVPAELIETYLRSIVRALRPEGLLILGEYDVASIADRALVEVGEALIDASLGRSWAEHSQRALHLAPIASWSEYLQAMGLRDTGQRLPFEGRASTLTLLAFQRGDTLAERHGGHGREHPESAHAALAD